MKLALATTMASATIFTGTTVSQMTFYGWPDNDPAGAGIAYPVIHKKAGGVGTYQDPITFASSAKEFKKGTKLYIPSLKKYVIMEDSCAECETDWKKGKSHIDIWLNSDNKYKKQVLACEDKYTANKVKIVQNPPSNEPVNTAPLFNTSTGKCL